VLQRILNPPEQSFFLMGPRGSGKTTWLRATFPDAHVIDLLAEETYQRLLTSPGLFADELRAVPSGKLVIIDEVQRLPNLLNEVHRFIEEKHLRFVLCGSSARKLKRAGVNLLAGRAMHRSMHPFVPEELGTKFDIEDALRHGLLPIVWDSTAKEETLGAYAMLYLKEEIQAEALVRNLPGFARFLPAAAIIHGQTVNVSNLARESGVARTTVAGYLDIQPRPGIRGSQDNGGGLPRHPRGDTPVLPSSWIRSKAPCTGTETAKMVLVRSWDCTGHETSHRQHCSRRTGCLVRGVTKCTTGHPRNGAGPKLISCSSRVLNRWLWRQRPEVRSLRLGARGFGQ